MNTRRRFYKLAAVTPGNGVALDGRPLRTPLKQSLILPTLELAEAIAAEWQAQGEKIEPETMYLTKLANTAIDRMPIHRAAIEQELVDYAGSDLICYRAEAPPDLAKRQAEHWDPVLKWVLKELGASFAVACGVMHRQQSAETLEAYRSRIGAMNPFKTTSLHTLTTLTGSALASLMLVEQAIDPGAAWAATHVDEDYQIEHWGWDHEAKHRRDRRHAEFFAAVRFAELSGQ
ncbi:MAG: ATPase [Rhizobiales bacterium]|nr:ATPase [Hyphomicrobiales bacterium]